MGQQHAASRTEARLRTAALPYDIAADSHWATAGTTALAGPHEIPNRRATRTAAGEPLNLSVYDLALDADAALRAFAHRFGDHREIPEGRTALAVYAAGLAETDPRAERSYRIQRVAENLRAALTIGDADALLGQIKCPKCLCWSLVGVRNVRGAWQVTCQNRRCASDPADGRPDDPDSHADEPACTDGRQLIPRSWSLHSIARHHLYGRTA